MTAFVIDADESRQINRPAPSMRLGPCDVRHCDQPPVIAIIKRMGWTCYCEAHAVTYEPEAYFQRHAEKTSGEA